MELDGGRPGAETRASQICLHMWDLEAGRGGGGGLRHGETVREEEADGEGVVKARYLHAQTHHHETYYSVSENALIKIEKK